MNILNPGDGTDLRSLFIGAASLAVILVTLYRGAWRAVAHVAFILAFAAACFFMVLLGIVVIAEYWDALFGPAEERGKNLLAAVYHTAIIIGIFLVLCNERLMRALAKLTFMDDERR